MRTRLLVGLLCGALTAAAVTLVSVTASGDDAELWLDGDTLAWNPEGTRRATPSSPRSAAARCGSPRRAAARSAGATSTSPAPSTACEPIGPVPAGRGPHDRGRGTDRSGHPRPPRRPSRPPACLPHRRPRPRLRRPRSRRPRPRRRRVSRPPAADGTGRVCDRPRTADATAPQGAVVVSPAVRNDLAAKTAASPAGTTFWLAPGVHTLADGAFAQVSPNPATSTCGAPGAVLDGRASTSTPSPAGGGRDHPEPRRSAGFIAPATKAW